MCELKTTPAATRRADIQGLRAVAVAVVVLFHADLGFSGGYVGVDVFFVVSGYVITRMLRREQGASDTLRLGRFYLRRIRRLLPALALLLLVTALALPLLGPLDTQATSRRTAATAALFVSNLSLARGDFGYFAQDATANPFLHLWSLSVEEQFYLGFPLLMLVTWWVVGRWRAAVAALAAVLAVGTAASFALNLWLLSGRSTFDPGYATKLAFFLSPPRAWEFLAGALAALVVMRCRRVTAEAISWAGLAAVAVAVFVFDDVTAFPGTAALVPVLGTVALLLAGDGRNPDKPGPVVPRVLSHRALGWLGDRSYAWYLWHWPFIVFARASFPTSNWAVPAAALLSLVPTVVSYRWVETPIRHRRDARPLRTLSLGAVCVVVPLLAVGLAWKVEQVEPPRLANFTDAFEEHAYVALGCDDHSTTDSEPVPEACTIAPPGGVASRGHVVLVGDSNAGQFHEAVVAAGAREHLTVTITPRAACSFVDLRQFPGDAAWEACKRYRETRLEWMARTRPDLVVMAGVSDLRIGRDADFLADPVTGRRLRGVDEKARAWEASLERTLRELHELGIRTIVVHPVPRLPAATQPGLCSAARVLIDEGGCGGSVDESEARAFSAPALRAEVDAIARVPGTLGLDLWPELCPGGRCPAFRSGTWWFRDANHISVHASEALAPRLAEAFEDALGPA